MIPWLAHNLLSAGIFAPLFGVVGLLLLPRRYEAASREIALVASGATLVLAGCLGAIYLGSPPATGFAFATAIPWIPDLGIDYRIGVDGPSVALILLTALLTPICVLCSWRDIVRHRKEFMLLLLLVEVGLNGAFASLDLFLFYIFWEVMLIPMYFLVGIWGGEQRVIAAMKFLLYTMVGSVLMLVAILYLYFAGGKTFNLLALYEVVLAPKIQLWLFLAFALAFAIKVPLFPFHTWLPDAHTEAPTAGSIMLAGVFLKVGTYGFYRFAMPLFPDAVLMARPTILCLAVIGIVGGALVSMVQTDVKRLIAYSSVSHLGFVMLGLFALTPEAVQGAVIQMINHGLSTGALFLLFGMLYERTHHREIAYYGGIGKMVPLYTTCFLITALSSLGLPGLNNFVGEFLVLLGTFRVAPWHAAVAAIGVIFGAVYLLWLIERVFFGPLRPGLAAKGVIINQPHSGGEGGARLALPGGGASSGFADARSKTGGFAESTTRAPIKDMGGREVLVVMPLLVLMVWLGVAPGVLLRRTAPSVDSFVHLVHRTQVPPSVPVAMEVQP